MRKVAILAASLLLLVMFVNMVGQNVEGGADDPIHIDLNVKFHGKDRGTLIFLMEAGEEEDPQWKDGVPSSIDPFVNENMKRVLKALRRGGLSEERLMDSIFRNNGNIEIEDSRVSAGFGLRLQIPFFGPVPMSLDFGFPLNKTNEDDTQLVSFSIGWVF